MIKRKTVGFGGEVREKVFLVPERLALDLVVSEKTRYYDHEKEILW